MDLKFSNAILDKPKQRQRSHFQYHKINIVTLWEINLSLYKTYMFT